MLFNTKKFTIISTCLLAAACFSVTSCKKKNIPNVGATNINDDCPTSTQCSGTPDVSSLTVTSFTTTGDASGAAAARSASAVIDTSALAGNAVACFLLPTENSVLDIGMFDPAVQWIIAAENALLTLSLAATCDGSAGPATWSVLCAATCEQSSLPFGSSLGNLLEIATIAGTPCTT